MEVSPTQIQGCFVIQPNIFGDDRGFFFELYNQREFEKIVGVRTNFVQDNLSVSQRGTLRGLHFQKGEAAQSKLVSVLKGEVLDVVVDIRVGSPTFGNHVKINLSDKNKKQLFIPKGLAHGFISLVDDTHFWYKCDSFYSPLAEGGIMYNDVDLGIDWEFPHKELIISKKDQNLPSFKSTLHDISFSYGG